MSSDATRMDGAVKPAPARIPSNRIVHFDYIEDVHMPDDPHTRLRTLREAPHDMMWTTARGGHWIATRQKSIRRILQDPDLFSNAHINIPPMAYRAIELIPEELDPPEHTKYRAILNPIFSPAAVGDLEANARTIARQLVEACRPDGQADFVKRVTVPMPCSIFMALVGLPQERLDEFLLYKDQFLFASEPAEKKRGITSIAETIQQLVADRRARPQADMMSRLIASEVDGRPLNDSELLSMGFLLFLAGLDTVTSTMSSCFAHLAQNSDVRDRLAAEPALIKDAIDEVVRRYSVVNLVRTATRDADFDGLRVMKGDQVLVSTILANLDDRAVDDPMRFELEREGNAHLGFGLGPHRCAGSHLARIELKVLLQEALPRLKNLRLQPGAKLHWHAANLVGLTALPLEWDVA